MQWILKHLRGPGVLYFADDDNTYDLRIFEEIRKTRKVSVFPVAYIGTQSVSSPIVETRVGVDGQTTTKVIGFTDDWFASRKFPVDMAGETRRISNRRREFSSNVQISNSKSLKMSEDTEPRF